MASAGLLLLIEELFMPALDALLPTSDSKRIPQQWGFSFLLFFVLKKVIAEG